MVVMAVRLELELMDMVNGDSKGIAEGAVAVVCQHAVTVPVHLLEMPAQDMGSAL